MRMRNSILSMCPNPNMAIVESLPTSSSRSSVVVCCGIPVVKKPNTSSVVCDYFGLRVHADSRLVSPSLQQSVERMSRYPTQSEVAQELNYAVTYFQTKDVLPIAYH